MGGFLQLRSHGWYAVVKCKSERRIGLLNLFESAFDHHNVRSVADETSAEFEQLGRMLGSSANGAPMYAGCLGCFCDAFGRFDDVGIVKFAGDSCEHA